MIAKLCKNWQSSDFTVRASGWKNILYNKRLIIMQDHSISILLTWDNSSVYGMVTQYSIQQYDMFWGI